MWIVLTNVASKTKQTELRLCLDDPITDCSHLPLRKHSHFSTHIAEKSIQLSVNKYWLFVVFLMSYRKGPCYKVYMNNW